MKFNSLDTVQMDPMDFAYFAGNTVPAMLDRNLDVEFIQRSSIPQVDAM